MKLTHCRCVYCPFQQYGLYIFGNYDTHSFLEFTWYKLAGAHTHRHSQNLYVIQASMQLIHLVIMYYSQHTL